MSNSLLEAEKELSIFLSPYLLMKVNAIQHSRGFLKASLLHHKTCIQQKLCRNWRIRKHSNHRENREGSNYISYLIKASNVLAKPTKTKCLPLGKNPTFSVLSTSNILCTELFLGEQQEEFKFEQYKSQIRKQNTEFYN